MTQNRTTFHPSAIAVPLLTAAALLAGCAGPSSRPFDPSTAPEAIRVPPGHRIAYEVVAVGKIVYECQQGVDDPDQFRWTVIGPDAILSDRNDRIVGKYYGPPATWDNLDSSRVTGQQIATAPAGAGNIPLQLVKADPSRGKGAFEDTSYVQRVNTKNGTAPKEPCNESTSGTRADVRYGADYVFWKVR